MRRIFTVILLTIFLVSCAAPTTIPTNTPTPTAESTATSTTVPRATEITPSMENLPADWQDKIDRVETMKNMDGSERIVAIQKGENPNEASKLRALQWNPANKERINYIPQVGWAGWGFDINGESSPYWAENVEIPETSALGEPQSLINGTKLPMGYLGRIYMTKDLEKGQYFKFFQGYILDIGDDGTLYMDVPLDSGDWQIYVTVEPDRPDISAFSMELESLLLSDFGKYYM